MSDNKIIFEDSPENPAVYESRTITGWWDNEGRFWGASEKTAKMLSSTHRKCERYPHHQAIEKNQGYCPLCDEERANKEYKEMPAKEYDGTSPVVILNTDQYFFDRESIEVYCKNYLIKPEDLKLVFCKPQYFHEIEPDDIYSDILPEDFCVDDVSSELSEAFNKLNEIIRKGIVASWIEGDTKVIWG